MPHVISVWLMSEVCDLCLYSGYVFKTVVIKAILYHFILKTHWKNNPSNKIIWMDKLFIPLVIIFASERYQIAYIRRFFNQIERLSLRVFYGIKRSLSILIISTLWYGLPITAFKTALSNSQISYLIIRLRSKGCIVRQSMIKVLYRIH